MEPKVDAKHLDDIVDEITRMKRSESEALDQEQTRQVLRELDLPADRLEEAQAAIALRDQLARAGARRLRLVSVAALVLVLGAVAVGWRVHARKEALAHMTASRTTLSLGQGGAPLSGDIDRSSRPELWLEVVLVDPPQGGSLDLRCEWTGPASGASYENHWETKDIDKSAWPTHCRRTFGEGDATGAWSVTMKQGDRALATEHFTLK